MNFVYKFPAIRGVQAKSEYYIAMVPLKMISFLFPPTEKYVAPEYRAQRRLNKSRIPIMRKYILDNRDSYVFSALAASIDGSFNFLPVEGQKDIGQLEINMDSIFLINDGQHRKAAILEALNEDETLGEETISVVFYCDFGLHRSQQIFTDLNKNAVKTSNSISELYDSRDELAVITRTVVNGIPFLNYYTDKERDNLGKFSSSLFTLNTFYNANKLILGKMKTNDAVEFLQSYWTSVCKNMNQWIDLGNGEITKKDLRENYISTQGVVIQALGKIGAYFYKTRTHNFDMYLKKLRKINWNRGNKEWYLRAINKHGRVITNKKAILLISNYIKKILEIELSDNEIAEELLLEEIRGEMK